MIREIYGSELYQSGNRRSGNRYGTFYSRFEQFFVTNTNAILCIVSMKNYFEMQSMLVHFILCRGEVKNIEGNEKVDVFTHA